jgi:hypothetical protein
LTNPHFFEGDKVLVCRAAVFAEGDKFLPAKVAVFPEGDKFFPKATSFSRRRQVSGVWVSAHE